MPGAILHLTHAEMLANEPALAAPLREAMAQELPFARLGSIFPDLPYYTSIVPMTLGYWLERPAENCPIAGRMHSDHPDRFAWHFLCTARHDALLTRAQRLALMGGYFAHVALDLELHPLVNWCARRDTIRHGGHESHHHRLAEKYQSIFFHIDREGKDCLGTRDFFERRSRIVDDRVFFGLRDELPLVKWMVHVLDFYKGDEITTRQAATWLRTFRHFAFLVSTPMAARNSARLANAENRRRYYHNEDFSFDREWSRGYQRSVELLNLAYATFAADDFKRRYLDFLGTARISDLAYPPERDLPPLPTAEPRQLGMVPV